MTRNEKRDVFIVADGGRKLDTEADLFKGLDDDEAKLLKQHPNIENDVWRAFLRFDPESAREQIAVQTLDKLRVLRDALKDPDTPAWEVTALGIAYQDLIMIYRQRENATAIGKVYSKRSRAREAQDELTVRVLRHLRSQDKTWKKTLRALESAAKNETKIADVEIEYDGGRFFFSRHGESDQVEDFKVSTLQYKKFLKAR